MKKLASTEFQHKSGRNEYYKVYVANEDGSEVKGSKTLNAFTGSKLRRVEKETQEEIDKGVWSNR